MKTISYKGKLDDGGTDTLALRTKNGKTGYRITKFQIFPNEFGAAAAEHTVKIYSIPQSSVDAFVDFTDNTLLAAAAINNNASGHNYPLEFVTIFDNMTFNQNIYVTHVDNLAATACNYYIELEQIALSDMEATMATLKDIRAIES